MYLASKPSCVFEYILYTVPALLANVQAAVLLDNYIF